MVSCGPQEIYMCSDGSVGGAQEVSSTNVVFVCPDGYKTKDISQCNFIKRASLDQHDAEENALQYVNGYVADNGWNARLVNAFTEEEHWYAQISISKRDEQSFQTTVKIDGEKGIVSCIQNCDFI